MGTRQKKEAVGMIGVVVLWVWVWVWVLVWEGVSVTAAVDCTTVTGFVSACSTFVTYGSPDPFPGSPCCEAVVSLNSLADSFDNRLSVCRCLISLISIYNPDPTAIANLPSFCGVTLGFTTDPNSDCNYFT